MYVMYCYTSFHRSISDPVLSPDLSEGGPGGIWAPRLGAVGLGHPPTIPHPIEKPGPNMVVRQFLVGKSSAGLLLACVGLDLHGNVEWFTLQSKTSSILMWPLSCLIQQVCLSHLKSKHEWGWKPTAHVEGVERLLGDRASWT